jgi:hypothetical protein
MEAAEKASLDLANIQFGQKGEKYPNFYDAICLLFCILFILPVLGSWGVGSFGHSQFSQPPTQRT